MKIRYFAWLREHIGTSGEDIAAVDSWKTVSDLVDFLRQQSAGHQKALDDMTLVRVAVNHVYVDLDHPVSAHDEIAFFPPVTGG
ncbi:MAG: molybdopterin converting factor subunit 1 [Candidatus Puniceispirillales bacterium]|nr:molybdopterin converting factor subunit 1 [Pseudomonadota bacterium]